jgi:hypothetical protein
MTAATLAELPAGLYGVPDRYQPEHVTLLRLEHRPWGPNLRIWPPGTQAGPEGPGRRVWLADITAAILADPAAAAAHYAVQTSRCCHCSTPLSDPASRARGVGPRCATDVDPDHLAAIGAAIAPLSAHQRPRDTWRRTGQPVNR